MAEKSDEEKRASWSKLASARGSAAMDALRLLGHLANPTQYAWTDDQEERLFGALGSELERCRAAFVAARSARASGSNGTRQLSLQV